MKCVVDFVLMNCIGSVRLNKLLENCPQIIPQETVQKIVVLLHGYGSNGDDLIEIAKIYNIFFINQAPNVSLKVLNFHHKIYLNSLV